MFLYEAIEQFLFARKKRNYASESLRNYGQHLRAFAAYLEEEQGITDLKAVTPSVLKGYARHLSLSLTKGHRYLSSATINAKLSVLRSFFRFLRKQGLLFLDPSRDLVSLRIHRGAKVVLSEEEMKALLSMPDVKTPTGIRDRAILEVLYATGIRRGELVTLNLVDVDLGEELLTIRQGKGGKDRLVPLGRMASGWLSRYLEEVRPLFACGLRDGGLWLSHLGRRLSAMMVALLVRESARQAGIQKRVTCHLLRHTCATHLLEGGADIRMVAELLGHSQISTTQIYLQRGLVELKQVHERCHPRGRRDETRKRTSSERAGTWHEIGGG